VIRNPLEKHDQGETHALRRTSPTANAIISSSQLIFKPFLFSLALVNISPNWPNTTQAWLPKTTDAELAFAQCKLPIRARQQIGICSTLHIAQGTWYNAIIFAWKH